MKSAALLLLAPALSACAAAAVPVVVAGAAARHRLRAAQDRPVPPAPVSADREAVRPPPSGDKPAEQAGAIPSLPADLTQAKVGGYYQGQLPPPDAAVSTRPPVAIDKPAADAAGWPAIGRYVAEHMAPDHGALLARGEPVGSPGVSCAGKPPAVLASAALVTAGLADATDRPWLEALRTLGVELVRFGPTPPAKAMTDGEFLVATSPAELSDARARAAARYCVVALAGQGPADFPNGYAPDTTPAAYRDRWGAGWFLFPAR